MVFLLRKHQHLSQIILGFWLLTNSILLFGGLFEEGLVQYFKPGVFPLLFLFGPFLYFYVRSLVTENFQFRPIHLLHLLPFLSISMHRVFTDPITYSFTQTPSEGPLFNAVYYILMLISILTYWVICILLILSHRKNILNHFSYRSARITLNWTWMMVLLNMALFIFPLLVNNFSQTKLVNSDIYHFNLAIFSYLLTLFGLRQPVIFEVDQSKAVERYAERKKYARSGLAADELNRIEEKIDSYLKAQKPYLNPEFNLQMMSEDLGVARQYLSQVLNEHMKMNFNRLINEFRVSEVKRALSSGQSIHLTVLGIALDSGFNSKASFNRIFKEITGTTPSGFKKQLSTATNNHSKEVSTNRTSRNSPLSAFSLVSFNDFKDEKKQNLIH